MLLLVDYLSLLYRAYHSVPDTVSANGVHGILSMLARLVGDRNPDRLAVCVDEDWRPAFRVAAIPSYKTHRLAAADGAEAQEGGADDPIATQDALGQAVLRAMGIPVAGAAGFEAEDVIATLTARAREPVEIVSGDRDLFALVRDPDVRVLYPAKGVRDLVVIDEAAITQRYGIPGRRYLDFALLRGDPSDGLPGVRGIGEKTASALIARYGSLDGVLDATDLPPACARRLDATARTYLATARRVVPPVADTPVAPLPEVFVRQVAHPEALADLGRVNGLTGAIERLVTALALA